MSSLNVKVEKAGCGCEANAEQICSFCLNHLCGGEKNYSLCYHCRTNFAVIASLPRRADGAVLCPVRMSPLTLCKCGKVFNQMCLMEEKFNHNPAHEIISGNPGFTQ